MPSVKPFTAAIAIAQSIDPQNDKKESVMLPFFFIPLSIEP